MVTLMVWWLVYGLVLTFSMEQFVSLHKPKTATDFAVYLLSRKSTKIERLFASKTDPFVTVKPKAVSDFSFCLVSFADIEPV